MLGTFEKSPLINSKETVISLDYVRIFLENVNVMFNNYFLQGTCSIVSPAKKGKIYLHRFPVTRPKWLLFILVHRF